MPVKVKQVNCTTYIGSLETTTTDKTTHIIATPQKGHGVIPHTKLSLNTFFGEKLKLQCEITDKKPANSFVEKKVKITR